MKLYFLITMLCILCSVQSLYAQQEPNKEAFSKKSELVNAAFYCSELNAIADNDAEHKRLGVIALKNGFEIYKIMINEYKKEAEISEFLHDLNQHYKISNEMFAGVLLGELKAQQEMKVKQNVNRLSEEGDNNKEAARKMIILNQCNLL